MDGMIGLKMQQEPTSLMKPINPLMKMEME
jgi:hypothetical protein